MREHAQAGRKGSSNVWGGVTGLLLCAAVVLPACSELIDEGGGGFTPPGGKTCYVNEDCVPNDCCGQGTGVVHVDDSPDCSDVKCDGSCSPGGVNCGCGLPYCSDGTCVVAETVSESCQ